MNHSFTLISDNIILVPMREYEAECYRVLRNKNENNKWFITSSYITEEQQKKWMNKYYLDDTQYMFGIYEKERNSFLGCIGLYNINSALKKAEIGRLIVDRDIASGRHLGQEAIVALSKIAKEKLDVALLYAFVLERNKACLITATRAGLSPISNNNGIIYLEMKL